LSTADWCRVFSEAESLGVMQLHLTGGEPLARSDLEQLIAHAKTLNLYTNLITSGIPLREDRFAALVRAGIDHVQVSLQSTHEDVANEIAGFKGYQQKLDVLKWVKKFELPLTINVVLHRANIDEIEAFIALAEHANADRLELANTQYLNWALTNRDLLLPTENQLEHAAAVAAKHKQRLRGTIDVVFVKPDYFTSTPKACMDGWARRFIHVLPDGRVVPCHAATSIASLAFDNVHNASLAHVWEHSEALNAFRGTAWMPEPCRSCDRRDIDFGGCRCQAYALLGDAAKTDPACALSPDHALIKAARDRSLSGDATKRYIYRGKPTPTG